MAKVTEKQNNLMKVLEKTTDKKEIYKQIDRQAAYHTARGLVKKGLVEIKKETIKLTEQGKMSIHNFDVKPVTIENA